MNCIFCKKDSATSKSVEHIIPESLGNETLILGKGIVCDKCNNYIAVKIEQPLLELPYFKQYRHELSIENKRGKIPDRDGFLIDPDYAGVKFKKHRSGVKGLEIAPGALKKIVESKRKKIPAFTVTMIPPHFDKNLSRFLGKVGIEALAWEANAKGYSDNHYNQSSLDTIKKYVRSAAKEEYWPYHVRTLYSGDHMFRNGRGSFKIISGWEFIITKENQLLFQYLFLGTEFTIDMLSPHVGTIENWLNENDFRSPVLESMENYISSMNSPPEPPNMSKTNSEN
jgi:hypothetical protein